MKFLSKFFLFILFLILLSTSVFLGRGINFYTTIVAAVNYNFGSQTYENSNIPVILPRALWENSSDLTKLLDWYPSAPVTDDEKNSPPDYSSVDRIIIHDMGCDTRSSGCNNNKLDPITIIQNIYRYHAISRGWGDIGYHYIIDYWGNIYEGRYGGNGVRGAHTYYDKKCDNFNVGSIGILLMGNYAKNQLPELMYNSLERLVAWLSATNGLNPSELNHTSEIWHSIKKASGCDLSQGGLTSLYSGPIVVGHGDIEEGNSDPGLVDLNRVRRGSNDFYLEFKNYLYKLENESNKIYAIENGVSKLVSGVNSSEKIVTLNKNQFKIFPSSVLSQYPNGTLVKSPTRDGIYLIEEGKRRPIFSEQLFNLNKLNWSKVEILSDRDLASYSLASPLLYPEKSLIRGEGPEIYLIENGKRRHISSAVVFEKAGFNWDNVIKVNQQELLSHPSGVKFLLSDDILVREEGMHPVYIIKDKKRHWIKTADVFYKLGYKWSDIIVLSSQDIGYYGVGNIITTVNDILTLNNQKITELAGSVIKPELTEENYNKIVDKEPNIRIGIYAVPSGENIEIKSNLSYEVYKNNVLLANKTFGESTIISYSEKDFYKFLPVEENSGTIFEIVSYEDHPNWNTSLNDNLFKGTVEVKYSPESQKLWVINELGLEDYLKGVAEALNNDPAEYLNAFIIAARSYALFHLKNGGKTPGEIFHIRNWAYDQLYKGYGFEQRAKNIVEAVNATKGIVATYNDKIVRTVYSSDSGGVTKSACDVFKGGFCANEDYNYLQGGVEDPLGTIHSNSSIAASHGVGMSSAGARRLAEMGKNFEEILEYYYLGIEVKKIY